MKVMIFSQPLAGGGGAERFVSNLTMALSRQIEFVVVWPQRQVQGTHVLPFHGRGIALDIGSSQALRSLVHRGLRFVRRLYSVHRLIREEKPDVVLSAFSYVWHVLLLALKMFVPGSPKLILRFGNPVSRDLDARDSTVRMFLTRAATKADRLVANSAGLADDIRSTLQVPDHLVTVINNPFFIEKIREAAKESVSEPIFDGSIPIVITVGRLEPQKNQELLIRAFRRVREQQRSKLVIIGSGSCEGSLRDLAAKLRLENDVVFMGWQENPYRFVSRASVFALTSKFEGFPNCLIEAMACGCPVVATNCRYGPDEILAQGRFGLLVPEDEEAVAGAIVRILGSGDLYTDLRQAGLRRADEYDVSYISGCYAELFRALSHRPMEPRAGS